MSKRPLEQDSDLYYHESKEAECPINEQECDLQFDDELVDQIADLTVEDQECELWLTQDDQECELQAQEDQECELEDDSDNVFDTEFVEHKQTQIAVSELNYLQQRLRDMYKMRKVCAANRLHLLPASAVNDWESRSCSQRLPRFSWQTVQDLLYVDNKPPCVHGEQCQGLVSKLDSMYWAPDGDIFRGAVLPAYNGEGTPCMLCLVHQVHSMVFLFLVNRLPLRNREPFQVFYNTDDDFHSALLLKPDNAVFNGLVCPVMAFVHDKMIWDFDQVRQQWFVNIRLYKKPLADPGVTVEITSPEGQKNLKQPKK